MSNKAFAEDEVRMMESSRLRKEALEHGNYRSITKLRDSIERKERGQPRNTLLAATESQDSTNSSSSRRKRDSEMSSRSQNFKADAGSMLSYNPPGKHSEQLHRSTMNVASDSRRQKSYARNLHDFNNTQQQQMQQSSQKPKEHSLRQRSIPPSSSTFREEKSAKNPRSLQYRLETDAREKERLLRDRGHTSGMTVRSEVSRVSEGSFQSTSSKSRTSLKKTDSELITRRPRSSSVVDSDTTRNPHRSGDSTNDRRRTGSVISRRSPHTNRSPVSSTTPPRRTASAVDLSAREKEAMLKLEGTEYKSMYSKVGTSNRVQPLSSTKKVSAKTNMNDMINNFSKTSDVVVSATKAREKRDAFRAQRKSNDAFQDLDGKPLLRNYDNRKASYDLIDVVDDKPLHRVDESFKRRTDESALINQRQRPIMRSNNNATNSNSSNNSNNTRSMDPETRTNERFRQPTNHAADTVEVHRANTDDRRKANPTLEDRYQRHRTSQNNHASSSSDMSLRRRPESSNGDNDLRKTEVSSSSYSSSSRRKPDMFGTSSNKSRRDMLVRDDSFTIDTLSGSTRSSNPFADAMKAILLDMNSPSGFNSEKEMEQRIADLVLGKLKRHTQRHHDAISEESFQSSTLSFVGGRASGASSGPPRKYATIVLTDVQGSTSLWEANPQAMQEALDLHDKIMRRFCAFHNGYEIDTEGDAFFLAFHNPMDAFGFALDTQSALYDTEWSKDILAIPAAKEEGSFSGLRVRMGIHHGPVISCKNEVTGRTEYVGEAMNICKCVEGMTHGGQILTTFETWNVASYKAEADLGSPQVVDIGCHMLSPKGFDEPIARRIIQLVPASLSYDYFAARRLEKSDSQGSSSSVKIGRIFDPPITDEQISASFNDAPFENNEVTIAFVYFSEIDNHFDDPKPVVAALIRLIGELLVGAPGYHSQSNMLAFPNVNEAIKFGLRLMDEVQEFLYDDKVLDLSKMIKMGCVHDTFLTMGPHKTTGRADYFGKVVNRAARITAKSELGTVNFGVLADDSVSNLPKLDHSIIAVLRGVKQLKGVQEEMALYECRVDHSVPLGLHM
jgi:class 3 adenylate cyclase